MNTYNNYLAALKEGVVADDKATDENPYPHDAAKQLGWWHGRGLSVSLAKEVTSDLILWFITGTAHYWKAHAQGMSACAKGVSILKNPYAPTGWDNFQCPETGDRTLWNGWSAGWRFATIFSVR